MVLYAKSLGASATVLGIIIGMMPLLVISQIPAANHIGRIGYKRFVYAGWGTRVVFIFVIAAVPVLLFLNQGTRLALVLFLLFIFNLSRGISSCAWLPWISTLVPGTLRGKYLAGDQACAGVASCLAFVIAALCLGDHPEAWQFAVTFLISGISGVISLIFLKRIPDVPVPEEIRTSKQPVPWLEMAKYAPFTRLLIMNLGWSVAYGGIPAFTVSYLRTKAGLPEDTILYYNSLFFLGGLLSIAFGARMDIKGSKPVMLFSCSMWMAIIGVWLLLAGRVIPAQASIIMPLQFAMGFGLALFNMANIRLTMVISPQMGRNHFFALYSVVANVSLGLAPVFWGMLIDLFDTLETPWHGFEFNRFTLFFAGSGLYFALTAYLMVKLEEPSAGKMKELMRDILVATPQRLFSKMWPRY